MANTKQALKRAKKSIKQRASNMSLRTSLRSAIKRVQKAIASGDSERAQMLTARILGTRFLGQA